MSCIYKGSVIETELSKSSKGGTEMMRDRLIKHLDPKLLEQVAIHFSRPKVLYEDVPNILYCHDLANDPATDTLKDQGHLKFDHIVFVSAWQRDQFIYNYKIPYDKCSVIHNAIEKKYSPRDKYSVGDKIKFIYHTTPHRGLELLVPVFEWLCEKFDNIELEVYSSFEIYGWGHLDEQYKELFSKIENHPKMNYHGSVSNEKVLEALDESHIFLYPNVRLETSCISMIEAIKSQVICIHPNFGALVETASNATIMYDYAQDANIHANRAYHITNLVIERIMQDRDYFNKITTSDRYNLSRNDVGTYRALWGGLLKNIVNK
jgi:glycosyltransferase involved in cell wall biosynthesis